MSRALPEWHGATPDTRIPVRVAMRIWERAKGSCQVCGRKLYSGDRHALDHVVALINGGLNVESNLRLVCEEPCHREKSRADVAEKATVARQRAKHLGIKRRSSRPMLGTRASGIRKRMNWQVERWP